jgi:hypothetical protein
MKNKQLLCTFTNSKDYNNTIREIKDFYGVINGKIFLLCNVNNPKELYATYNIELKDNTPNRFRNTISVHRKKDTNTLYTLNAMNKLIAEENGGVFDKTFQLDWNLYKNSIILTGDVSVKIISVKIFDIIN